MQEPGEDAEAAGSTSRFVVSVDVRTAVWVLVGLLAGFAFFDTARNASAILTKIVIGVILALALDGLVQSISRRWHFSRSVSVAIVGSALLALALIVVLLLGPPAVSQAREFSNEIPATVQDLYDLPIVGGVLERNDAAAKAQDWIDNLPANISDQTIADTAERLVGGVFSIVVVVFITFALLLDGERIINRGRRLLPESSQDEADRVGRVLYRSIGRYFGGSLTVAVLMGLYVLAIGLAFNVPLAPLAAIWAMLTDLIPQIGGFLGGALLFVLAVSNGVGSALVVMILFVIYMNLENHVISPAIVGQAVNLSPPTTMLAALLGGAVAGVPGALVATPLIGAVKQIYLSVRHGDLEPPEGTRAPSVFRRLQGRLRGRLRRRPPDPPTPTSA